MNFDISLFKSSASSLTLTIMCVTLYKMAITRCLQQTHKIEASRTNKWASLVHKFEVIRSTLFDTGTNGSLNHRDVEPYLEDSCYSNNRIGVANGGQMKGCSDGTLGCSILNTVSNTNSDWKTKLKHSTIATDGPTMELFSFDEIINRAGAYIADLLTMGMAIVRCIDRHGIKIQL